MSKVKMLDELRYHRDEDGTHVVEHHHASSHPPEGHRFKTSSQATGHFLGLMARVEPRGLPHPEIEEEEESQPDGGRPAGFDYGSTREGAIQGRRK